MRFVGAKTTTIPSVRILELQGSKPVYSRFSLLPVSAKTFRATAGEVILNLGASASRRPLVAVTADGPAGFVLKEPPPSSAEATELLIEFSAFLAALALPFYRNVGLQPQFPIASLGKPILQSTKSAEHTISTVRQYVADLRYYMTLSMHTSSIGSIIWSIFWQPDG